MRKILLTLLLIFITIFTKAVIPNWSDNIAKIVYGNCSSCHHPGGIGPFSLMTYQDAVNNAADIENSVTSRIMPPWTPDPSYKHYVHERILSPADVTAIQQWVANGTPSGDLRFAPNTPTYTNTSQLGTVDLSLIIPTYTVTSNNDVYRNFVLPSGLAQASYAYALEIIPGNTEIVHHVLVFQDSTNNPIDPTSTGGTGSAASKLVFGYTPGARPYYTPVGTGFKLAANTRIILQMHYAPGSLGKTDSTRINLKLTTSPQREILVNPLLNHVTSLINGPLAIPAGQTKTYNEVFPVTGNWTFLNAFPHMHLIGKSIISYATTTLPNDTFPFVKVPEWDFHWQDNFVFPNTVKIPSGAILRATAVYDNTTNNADNPNSPPQNVYAGESTLDEMMMVFFAYMPYQSGDEFIIVDRRVIPMGATTFCQGQSVLLKTIEGTGYTYQWYKNGSMLNGETTALYTAMQAGNYYVKITLGPNNTFSDTINVAVNSVPNASITPSGTTVIPQGGNVLLNTPSGSGYSFQWYLNGAAINNATNSSYSANTAGDYYVEVYNGCYSISNVVTLLSSVTTYTVNTSSNPIAGGTTSGGGSYNNGTSVTVTATANNGYAFVNWTESGSQVSANASYTFSISANRSLVANFSANPIQYNVTTTANPIAGGTTSGGGTFNNGTSVTVAATANNGYTFVNWTENGSQVSANASYTFTISANRSLVANFSTNPIQYNVTTTANPIAGGTTSGGGSYNNGTSATVTATANNGYIFFNWTENGSQVSTNASYTFSVSSNRNLVANFSANPNQYGVNTTANPIAGGVASGGGSFAGGTTVTVTATAFNGYTFVNWTENGNQVSTNASYTFTISANRNLIANFSANPVQYNVTTFSNPIAGGITSGDGNYTSGSTVNLTAAANNGYVFIDWTENGNQVCNTPSYTFNINADRNISANFLLTSELNDLSNDNAIYIYPNPTSGGLNIFSNSYQNIKLYNSLGQVIFSSEEKLLKLQIEIKETGIYLFQFTNEKGMTTLRRIIVQQ